MTYSHPSPSGAAPRAEDRRESKIKSYFRHNFKVKDNFNTRIP